jgi:hypothetical protein
LACGASDPTDRREHGDHHDELAARQVKSTADDFDRLPVPVQPAVGVDPSPPVSPIAIGRKSCGHRALSIVWSQFVFAFDVLLFSPKSFFFSFHFPASIDQTQSVRPLRVTPTDFRFRHVLPRPTCPAR